MMVAGVLILSGVALAQAGLNEASGAPDPHLAAYVERAPDWQDDFSRYPDSAVWARGYLPYENLMAGRILGASHEVEIYFDKPYLGRDVLEWRPGRVTFVAEPMTPEDKAAVDKHLSSEFVQKAQGDALRRATWVSSLLTSRRGFEYGYFESSLSIDNQASSWPAFWMAAVKHVWPPEIDILEVPGDRVVHQTIHSMPGDPMPRPFVKVPLKPGFHTYGVLWTPSTVRLYIDRHETLCAPTPSDMHQDMRIALNLAVGGWAKAPDASTPGRLSFDANYVKWWQYSAPGTDSGKAAPPDTCG